MPGWQWRLEATVMPLKRNERALQLWMVFTVTRHNENQGTSKVEYKIAALWALFFRGWRLPYALSSKSSHTSHLKLKTPDWGELMVCQWRIEAIEAGKTEEKNFTSWFGVCMGFSGLKSRAMKWHFDLTANGEFLLRLFGQAQQRALQETEVGTWGNRHQGEPSCAFWFWLKHSNLKLKPSEFKIGCVFSLGETGVLPKVGETWPLGAWPCHVASGIWSRALGWRLLRVKL